MTPQERDARLRRALHPFLFPDDAAPRGVLLAVSGGPDSTALLHAAATCCAPVPLHVATIDHGLRPGSAAEAEAVGALAARLGLPHASLRWSGPKPEAGLQAAARAARYDLLAAHAARIGAASVLTGHTADDQAETVLMRLLAGSGPAGLAGMAVERALRDGIRLGRPFLGIAKAELVAYCETHRLSVVQDPSNRDERFARGRLRALLPLLEREGLSTERLHRLALRARRDDEALSRWTECVLASAQPDCVSGAVREEVVLDGGRLLSEPEAIVLRVIAEAMDRVPKRTEDTAPRRLERLEALVLGELLPALRAGLRLRRTLRGVLLTALSNRTIVLSQAKPRRQAVTQSGHSPE